MKSLSVWAIAALVIVSAAPAALAQRAPETVLPARPNRQREGVDIVAVGRVQSLASADALNIAVRGMTFRVTYGAQLRGQRQNLKEGDLVRVTGELLDENRIDAEQIQIVGRGQGTPDDDSTGTISGIVLEARRMTINTGAGRQNVIWDQDTQFIRNGVRSSARQFAAGDRVRVEGRLTGNTIHADKIVQGTGRGGWTNGAVGQITRLDREQDEVSVDFGGETWRVKLADASLRRGGARITANDLRVGQDIRVDGVSAGERVVDAASVAVVDEPDRPIAGRGWKTGAIGEVVRVREAAKEADVTFGGEVWKVELGESSLRRGGTRIGIDDLRPGMRVRVDGTLHGTRTVAATSLAVVAGDAPANDDTTALKTFEGRINRVLRDEDALLVQVFSGLGFSDEDRVETTDTTTFVRAGARSDFGALRQGHRIKVVARKHKDHWVATRIELP